MFPVFMRVYPFTLCLLLGLFVANFAHAQSATPTMSAQLAANTRPAPATPRTIIFLGDSLTAGYGLPDPTLAFPGLIERRLQAAGRGDEFRVVNAGVSGDTSAGGVRRIDWLLSKRTPDILVLELGANDGLRGIPPEETRRNLQAIIEKFRARNPAVRVLVGGMLLPPSLGVDYVTRFVATFAAVAKANDATLIPFILEGVGGHPELNQPDGIHPTAGGHRIVADLVWRYLEPVLGPPVATPAR